ncbi:MAG: ISAzo13 family transposase [Candidatus Competibacteraceae bacterium]|nr:ISAzo13 family transposase [Candidatus Competibacteraceae bacterium]MCB1793521.1 ISAzo13 family transposase [Candidatus Competibacteraceae bacterium]HRX71232.1 ISAzo13 family transposase [Candidatus Competibacteraceae bacterium]
MGDVGLVRQKFEALHPLMDERMRRWWAGSEAIALGRGGIAVVAEATGMARNTVVAGIREQRSGASFEPSIRRRGGGRKRLTAQDPALLVALESLVEPVTRGDPQSPLRWTSKSVRKLADELGTQGYRVSARTVNRLLGALDYSLQANRKTREGSSHPDRDAQFAYINERSQQFQRRGQPVVSVDAKKKELVGAFKNGGREWRPKGEPERVNVYDFRTQALGRAVPYGVYDVAANRGWVSVGMDHDTAEFAVGTLRRWWHQMGQGCYPAARELLIVADGGGSNGSRTRLWKTELQRLADDTGLAVSVCHLPPGTSKWNKIEHRLFAYISQNWRGRPLVSFEVIVNLIADTTTATGLEIQAELDTNAYPKGRKVSDEELARVRIARDAFHGEWNYTIKPQKHG